MPVTTLIITNILQFLLAIVTVCRKLYNSSFILRRILCKGAFPQLCGNDHICTDHQLFDLLQLSDLRGRLVYFLAALFLQSHVPDTLDLLLGA